MMDKFKYKEFVVTFNVIAGVICAIAYLFIHDNGVLIIGVLSFINAYYTDLSYDISKILNKGEKK